MKDRIMVCFEALKQLDIRPTPGNVSILNGVYENLRAVYSELNEQKEGEDGGECARETSDTE